MVNCQVTEPIIKSDPGGTLPKFIKSQEQYALKSERYEPWSFPANNAVGHLRN